MSNIKSLPSVQDKMLGEFEKLKRNLAIVEQSAALLAATRKRIFDAHMAAGFTEEQALTIVKGMF